MENTTNGTTKVSAETSDSAKETHAQPKTVGGRKLLEMERQKNREITKELGTERGELTNIKSEISGNRLYLYFDRKRTTTEISNYSDGIEISMQDFTGERMKRNYVIIPKEVFPELIEIINKVNSKEKSETAREVGEFVGDEESMTYSEPSFDYEERHKMCVDDVDEGWNGYEDDEHMSDNERDIYIRKHIADSAKNLLQGIYKKSGRYNRCPSCGTYATSYIDHYELHCGKCRAVFDDRNGSIIHEGILEFC